MNESVNHNIITFEWYAKADKEVSFHIWISETDLIRIDWGDGEYDKIFIDSNDMNINDICDALIYYPYNPLKILTHKYVHSDVYNLTITTSRCKHIALASNEDLSNHWLSIDTTLAPDLGALNCTRCRMEELDVSRNQKLRFLNCWGSQLESLDVSKNNELKHLRCIFSNLNDLFLGDIDIETIDCSFNNFSSLDFSGNKKLNKLIANNNPLLTRLILNTNIKEVDVHYVYQPFIDEEEEEEEVMGIEPKGKIKELDLDKCILLEKLNINNQRLSSINLSNNKNLIELNCSENHLTNLDITHNKKLETLDCAHNRLEKLDISKNKKLTSIKMEGNKSASIFQFCR